MGLPQPRADELRREPPHHVLVPHRPVEVRQVHAHSHLRPLRRLGGRGGFGAVFLAAIASTDPSKLSSTYSNQVEQAALTDTLAPAWPLIVLAQPFRCLAAVYRPLLMCTQSYAFWGKVVALLTCFVWLPLTLAAHATASFATFVLAFAAYDVLHVALLYYKVHLVEGARYARLAAEGARAREDAREGELGELELAPKATEAHEPARAGRG